MSSIAALAIAKAGGKAARCMREYNVFDLRKSSRASNKGYAVLHIDKVRSLLFIIEFLPYINTIYIDKQL